MKVLISGQAGIAAFITGDRVSIIDIDTPDQETHKSTTVLPLRSRLSNHVKHKAVVG